jgi:hypothetical protein
MFDYRSKIWIIWFLNRVLPFWIGARSRSGLEVELLIWEPLGGIALASRIILGFWMNLI